MDGYVKDERDIIELAREQAKFCGRCKEHKPRSEFNRDAQRKDGLHCWCKTCSREYARQYNKKNHQRIIELSRKSDRKNAKERNARARKKYNSDPAIRARKAVLRKKYYRENKWRWKEYWNKRYSNPMNRLSFNISRRIRQSLKSDKGGAHWEDIVGFSLSELKKHIEGQFQAGMSWDNYGKWHIDHKIPVAAFNFTDVNHNDFYRCWSLKNLQPMWAGDNQAKGDKLTKHFQPSLAV